MSRFPKWLASLYVLTNKHTSTPEEIICQCPVARVACPVCSADSHRNWKKTAWITTATCQTREIWTQGHQKWTLIGQLASTWRCIYSFVDFFVKSIDFALPTSSCWYCQNDSDVKAECPRTQAWVSHGVSCLINHIIAWNVPFLVLAHFDVSRWAVVISFCMSVDFSDVNNSGLCASHLLNFLSRWLLRHGTLIVH